jgi:hypothetical protein
MSIHINLSFETPEEAGPFIKALADCTEGVPLEELARWADDGGAPAREEAEVIPDGYKELPAGTKRRIYFRDTFKSTAWSTWPFLVKVEGVTVGVFQDVKVCGPVTLHATHANGKEDDIWIETEARLLVRT